MVIAFVLERETCILVAEIGLYVASVQVTADLRVNSRFGMASVVNSDVSYLPILTSLGSTGGPQCL